MEKENSIEILKSIEILFSVKEHEKKIHEFAREEYNKKYEKQNHVWYKGFEILDLNRLIINIGYGMGDIEMDDSFIINLK